MKIHSALLSLFLFHPDVWGTTAFSVKTPVNAFSVKAPKASSLALKSAAKDAPLAESSKPADVPVNMTPVIPLETIQGGGTVRTYKMPPGVVRCQYEVRTNGRPMKATVQLWIGPLRTVHTAQIDSMNGDRNPYRACAKFKVGVDPVLRITTSDDQQLPIEAGVYVPTAEESEALGENTEKLFDESPKQLIQGGSTTGGLGSVRTFNVDDSVDAVQLIIWSKDAGKKSFKQKVEVLHGPNNVKQKIDLQCGGGTQPYHAIISTPGSGWIIRMQNKKFVEDGLVEAAVIPYVEGAKAPPKAPGASKEWWDRY